MKSKKSSPCFPERLYVQAQNKAFVYLKEAVKRERLGRLFRYKARTPMLTLTVSISAFLYGAGDRGRTGTVSLPLDFESSTSANSIIPAY